MIRLTKRMRYTAFLLVCGLALTAFWWNPVEKQAQKLGNREFTPAAWAAATKLQRAEMTASFLKQHDTRNFTLQEVEALLGAPTGYYDYDSNAAYVVGPDTVRNIYGKGYLFVFEGNKNDGRIDNVFFVPEVE